MALETDLPSGGPEAGSMRLMAIAASHTVQKHFALKKRAVDIHFLAHLPVRIVKAFLEQSDLMSITE
jgi:hypothetical protein